MRLTGGHALVRLDEQRVLAKLFPLVECFRLVDDLAVAKQVLYVIERHLLVQFVSLHFGQKPPLVVDRAELEDFKVAPHLSFEESLECEQSLLIFTFGRGHEG